MSKAVEIPEDVTLPASSIWAKWPILVAAGVVCLGIAFSTWGSNKEHILFSYLFAFMTMLSIALGCLAFVIIQHLVRAGWSASVRRLAENGAVTLPIFALLFVPILIGLYDHDVTMFPWSHEEHLDAILIKKKPYLNVGFFVIRAAIYFIVWSGLAFFFYSRSRAQDSDPHPSFTRSMWWASGGAVALYGLTQTFAAFDWLMSLQPHWFSTMFGVYFFAGSMLGAYSFMTLVAMSLQKAGAIKTAITTEHYHDFGKFLFGHTVFWAYIGFSQFFLIWYANIPEETEFFIHRLHHGWGTISWAMPLTHFFIPFFFLLSRHVKRSPKGLMIGAIYVFCVHIIDVYWLVMPNLGAHSGGEPPHAFHAIWIDVFALLGVGLVFCGAFGFFLGRNKLVAVGDPRLKESLALENF